MSLSSPCAACKLLRRKCTPDCIFAQYFPPDQPAKFANVHRVFGASNVAKLLKQLSPEQREDAVVSLAYEAEARLCDPVHGCVGYIYFLQHKLREVQHDLSNAKKELSTYIGPAAFNHFLPPLQQHAMIPSHPHQYHHQLQGPSPRSLAPFGIIDAGLGAAAQVTSPQGLMVMSEQQRQPMAEMHQTTVAVAVAAREQQILNSYSQHQGHDRTDGGATIAVAAGLPSRLATVPAQMYFNGSFTIEQRRQPQQYAEQPRAKARSEGRGGLGPS